MKNVIKSILILLGVLFFSCISTFALEEKPKMLSAGIELTEQIPAELIGIWRVVSNIDYTDSPDTFKTFDVVLWNLSKTGNVINLWSLATGVSASVTVEYVKNNTVRFTHEEENNYQRLTDTVEITIIGNKFTGKNYLSIKSYSSKDGSLLKEKTAVYSLKGDKISGKSVLEN